MGDAAAAAVDGRVPPLDAQAHATVVEGLQPRLACGWCLLGSCQVHVQLTVGLPWPLGTATAWACRSLGCRCTPLRTAQQCGSNQREHKSCRRSKTPSAARTVVAVRQPTVGIEPAERGEEPRRGAEVPLAQHRRGIVDALQHLRERRFVAWQAVQRAAAKVLGDTRAQAKPSRLRPRKTGQRVTCNQAPARGMRHAPTERHVRACRCWRLHACP